MARTCDLGMRSGRRKSNRTAGVSRLRSVMFWKTASISCCESSRLKPGLLHLYRHPLPLPIELPATYFFASHLMKSPLSTDKCSVRSRMESDVLVVDDSAAIRKILQRVLRQTGMAIGTIHEAGDGHEAMSVLGEHPVHLILSDINMPKMDGLQLLASLKSSPDWRGIPVVMITTEG